MRLWQRAMLLSGLCLLAMNVKAFAQSDLSQMTTKQLVRELVRGSDSPSADASIRMHQASTERTLGTAIEGANRCESNLRLHAAERTQLDAMRREAERLRGQIGGSGTDQPQTDNGADASESEYSNSVFDWLRGREEDPQPGTSTPGALSEQAVNDKLRTEGLKIEGDDEPSPQRFQSLDHLETYINEETKRLDQLEEKDSTDLKDYHAQIENCRDDLSMLNDVTDKRADRFRDALLPVQAHDSGIPGLIDGVKQEIASSSPPPGEPRGSRIDRIRGAVEGMPMLIGPTLGERLDRRNRDLSDALSSVQQCQESVDRLAETREQDAETRRQIQQLREEGPSPDGDTPLEIAVQQWGSLDAFEAHFEAAAQSRRDSERLLRDNLQDLKDEVVSREGALTEVESTIETLTDFVIDERIRDLEEGSPFSDLFDGVRSELESNLLADDTDHDALSDAGVSQSSDSDSVVSQLLDDLDLDQMSLEEYDQLITQQENRTLEEMLDYETRQQASSINQSMAERDYQLALQRQQQRIRAQQNYWNQIQQQQQRQQQGLSPAQIQALQQFDLPIGDLFGAMFGGSGGGSKSSASRSQRSSNRPPSRSSGSVSRPGRSGGRKPQNSGRTTLERQGGIR